MGPEAAVNAVYYNKIQEVPEGPSATPTSQKLRDEYRADVDLMKLATELVVDEVIPGDELRDQLERRLEAYARRFQPRSVKKHGVLPV